MLISGCVDRLANLGLKKDLGVHWLTSPSKDHICMLYADLVGVAVPRSCPIF